MSPSLWPTRFRGCDTISSLSGIVGCLKPVIFGSAAAATFGRTAGEVVDVGARAGRGAANGDCTVGRPKSGRATPSQPVRNISATPIKHVSCAVCAITAPVDMLVNAAATASRRLGAGHCFATMQSTCLGCPAVSRRRRLRLATGLSVPGHKRIELCFWQVWGENPSSLKVRWTVLSQK